MPPAKELIGKRFTRLIVVERSGSYVSPKGCSHAQWTCRCDCGKVVIATSGSLLHGNTKSCGCLKAKKAAIRLSKISLDKWDLVGKRFSRLVVEERAGSKVAVSGKRYSRWLCRCDCGVIKVVAGVHLRSGHTTSCGCYDLERKRLATGEAQLNTLYGHYKYSAKKRGHSFELTKEEFRLITKQSCFYCGLEPLQVRRGTLKQTTYIYNGIDRRDPIQGYLVNNCVPCCGFCNYMKGNLPAEQFDAWIVRLAETHIKKSTQSERFEGEVYV